MRHLTSLFLFLTLALASCDSKPKVIEAQSSDTTSTQAVAAADTSQAPAMGNDMHQVSVVEVLQAERYTYLKVKEKLSTFWIATKKLEAQVGESYLYQGGLLKTNFESLEHKRVFDKIYLVSEIINANAHPGGNLAEEHTHNHEVTPSASAVPDLKGAIKLSELIGNKNKYKGQKIVVAGTCVKANYGIMNKNWYHIQDGTKFNGKLCDFTITSNDNIPLGSPVAFSGTLRLNKDFGAGYVYELIMEDGALK
jgi:hypothetical protein